MSFSIPITFDDFPFFERRDFRPSRPGTGYSTGNYPGFYRGWNEPEYFYGYPRRQHYQPAPQTRGNRRRAQQPSRYALDSRFEDESEHDEGIADSEEHSGIREEPNGWEIPVQFVDNPVNHPRRHVKKETPKANVNYGKVPDNCPKGKGSEGAKTSCESQMPAAPVNSSEELGKTIGEDCEVVRMADKKFEEDKPENSEKSSLQNAPEVAKAEAGEAIEIPIEYTPIHQVRRQQSNCFSDCDPPSSADIKLARINSILERSEGIEQKITEFVDPIQSQNYLYISETLMKMLLDLDTVDSEGIETVRSARKQGVQAVQALVEKLENKLKENKKNMDSQG